MLKLASLLCLILSPYMYALDSEVLSYLNDPKVIVKSPYSGRKYPVMETSRYDSQILDVWGEKLIIINPFELIIIRDQIQGISSIYFSYALIRKYAIFHEIAHAEFYSKDEKKNECFADVMALTVLTRNMDTEFMRPFVLYRFAEFRKNSEAERYKNHHEILSLIDFPVVSKEEALSLCKATNGT